MGITNMRNIVLLTLYCFMMGVQSYCDKDCMPDPSFEEIRKVLVKVLNETALDEVIACAIQSPEEDIIINSTDWFLIGTEICYSDTENVESIPGVVRVEDDEVVYVDDGVQNYELQ